MMRYLYLVLPTVVWFTAPSCHVTRSSGRPTPRFVTMWQPLKSGHLQTTATVKALRDTSVSDNLRFNFQDQPIDEQSRQRVVIQWFRFRRQPQLTGRCTRTAAYEQSYRCCEKAGHALTACPPELSRRRTPSSGLPLSLLAGRPLANDRSTRPFVGVVTVTA